MKSGGADEDRTRDLCIANATLSQLSYGPRHDIKFTTIFRIVKIIRRKVMKDCLQQAREVINEVDAQMAELFEKRMTAVQQVLAYKKEHNLPILDAAREQIVIEKGVARIQDPVLKPYYEELLIKQMELSRRYQKTLLAASQDE
ncbi:putative chorismate mutase [Holdemania filiformis DSM 12042]|nr:putative chorismate mutase [Holdemania filiformis DSM 12042]